MKYEKLLYVIISTVLITAFVMIGYISSPINLRAPGSAAKKLYYVDHISATHQFIIKKFNEKYKGQIEVVPINLPFEKFSTNERKEILARFLRSKSDRIDIFAVDQIWVPRFAKWGIPLEKYISPLQKENLLKFAMQSCYYDGQLVAVPLYIDVALMYYRRDLLERLPDYAVIKYKIENSISWEDFFALKKRLATISNSPFYTFQADDYEGLMCSFIELLASQGTNLMNRDSLILNTPQARRALKLLVDMVNSGISPKEVVKYRENQSYNYFIDHDGYFLRGWPAFLNDYKSDARISDVYEKLERAPLPHFEGGKAVSVYGGWNLVISRYSTKIPESVIFVNYLISEEAQRILYESGKFLPVNSKMYSDTAYIKKHKNLVFYKSILEKGVYRPFSEKYTIVSDVISYYLNLAIKNKMTVEEALSKAEEKVNSQDILLK
ncbi:MAG: extracellular solute-binding protein [Clostridiales bacterium]